MSRSVVMSIRIDPLLKQMFERSTKDHNLNMADVLEQSLHSILDNIYPYDILELKIQSVKEELETLESIKEQKKELQAKKHKDQPISVPVIDQEAFKEKREELFKTGPGTLIHMLNKGNSPAWEERIYLKYGFLSAKEMEALVIQEAVKRGLI